MMKKISLIVFGLILFSTHVFAEIQNSDGNGNSVTAVVKEPAVIKNDLNSKMIKLNSMSRQKLFMSQSGIQEMRQVSKELNFSINTSIYNMNKKDPWGASVGNLFLPSVGSWVIGDIKGALITDIGFIGSMIAVNLAVMNDPNKRTEIDSQGREITVSSSPLAQAAAVAAIGFYIYNIISPFLYTNEYNNKLQQGLNMMSYDRSINYHDYAKNNFTSTNPLLFNIKLVEYSF